MSGTKDKDDSSSTTILGDVGRVLVDPFSNPGDLASALRELNIDAHTIGLILSALDDGEKDMPRHVTAVAADSFGDLEASHRLGYHSGKAHRFLQDSVTEMLETLGAYVTGVKAFQHGANTTDEHSAADLRRIRATIETANRINDRQHRRHG